MRILKLFCIVLMTLTTLSAFAQEKFEVGTLRLQERPTARCPLQFEKDGQDYCARVAYVSLSLQKAWAKQNADMGLLQIQGSWSDEVLVIYSVQRVTE